MNAEAWTQAKAIAAAIRRLDPLDENAALSMAESLFRLGSKREAVGTLEAYLAECEADAPELQLRANLLLRRIRSVDDRAEWGAEPRFVGRIEELRRIDGLLYDARKSQGGALVLGGPAGIGKTRLLDEARSRAAMAGMQTVRIRCQRGDVSRPLSGIADLVPQLLDLRGAAGCQPEHLARLQQLANPQAFAEGDRKKSRPDPQVQRARLMRALVDLMDAVSSEAPLVLQIDDVQWVDKSLKWLWDDLLSSTQATPIAWLFAFRTSRNDAPALPIPVVLIGSLELVFATELVADLARVVSRRADSDTFTAILSRGAGSPLFIRELVRQWDTRGSTESLPTSLRGVIDRGLNGIGKRALRLSQVGAVLGTNGTLERIQQICTFSNAQFIDALVELEARGILTADRHGQTFGHVLWAEAALGQLSSTIVALLHRDAAERLEAELETHPIASLLWDIARHWERAGQLERALAAVVRGAEHLFDNGFPADAAAAYARAERMTLDPHRGLELLQRRIGILEVAGSYHEVIAEVERYEALASGLDPRHNRHNHMEFAKVRAQMLLFAPFDECLAGVMHCLRDPSNDAHHRLGAAAEAATLADRINPQLLYEINEVVLQITVEAPRHHWDRLLTCWTFVRRFGDIVVLPSLSEQLVAVAQDEGSDLLLSRALCFRGMSSSYLGRIGHARTDYANAARLAEKRGFGNLIVGSRDALCGVSLEFDEPVEIHRRLDDIARLLEDDAGGGRARQGLMFLRWHRANLAAVEGRFDDALTSARLLSECLDEQIARSRVRLLAVHLAARIGVGRTDDLDEIASGMTAAFDFPDVWLDWPATVYADYLERFVSIDAAKEFAHRFVHTIRRELYPPPARLQELASDAGARSAEPETAVATYS